MKIEYTNEVWKPIKGYEGLYEISNLGRVKSLNYNHTGRPEILKPGKADKYGHLQVSLYKDGKKKHLFVHRLVAEAFLEPVPGKDYIDHIDGNPSNNAAFNLRWCTPKENQCFPLARQNKFKAQNRPEVKKRRSKAMTNRRDQSKPVLQYTKSGEFVAEYPSGREASRQTGYAESNISNCCLKKRKSCGGYVWRYKEGASYKPLSETV